MFPGKQKEKEGQMLGGQALSGEGEEEEEKEGGQKGAAAAGRLGAGGGWK